MSKLPLRRSKFHSLFKSIRFKAMFFLKTKNVKTLNSLLVKKKDKDFLDLKILITKDHSSLNSRLLNLLF